MNTSCLYFVCDLTSTELDAFIGILLAGGVSHNNMQDSSVLWRSDALPIFRAAMSYKRFLALSRYIRFDDGRTREFRQRSDKAAPIRDIWNFLNENLAKNYEPHETITVDEQLFPYRGKTKFTQFIPSKPAKYGIKIWWAYDSKTKYPLEGKLYTGRGEGEERESNQGQNVLLQLANRYSNTGRTLVADNFFTTLEGTKRLAGIGLAFVGTVRSNKRFLPEEMKKNSSRPLLSSLFGFHENLVSVCSYVPKKNKAVNLLSTVHYSKDCRGEAMKPEAILLYNSNKAGVDCMDQMVTHFTSKRPTRRWTYAFFATC
ncbi:piggyBac transposable element-derived protein 3-like [Eupeodes corollae]|uniref:piggyBac transposable element-derived protein 3-like n=1 Tax=Eupeodes corollae TaxID=290404 RepID=UPI0024922678|nr:piggyBac transposable element-derived protein 3-like [Eupeodes corollae]